MTCPKCRAPMETVRYAEVEVERCTGCGGLWFDLLEHEDLKQVAGSEAIDSGDPEVGRRNDGVGPVHCPVDGVPLTRMVHARQRHLWYEMCPVCHGVFFDAGEFSDFKTESFSDLWKPRRPRPL